MTTEKNLVILAYILVAFVLFYSITRGVHPGPDPKTCHDEKLQIERLLKLNKEISIQIAKLRTQVIQKDQTIARKTSQQISFNERIAKLQKEAQQLKKRDRATGGDGVPCITFQKQLKQCQTDMNALMKACME